MNIIYNYKHFDTTFLSHILTPKKVKNNKKPSLEIQVRVQKIVIILLSDSLELQHY